MKEHSIVSSSKLPRVAIHEREENEGGGGGGLIWTAEEYRIVRQQHRIVGALLGSLPGYRQQDATRGLPVLLSAEEVHVLETNKWAREILKRKDQRGGKEEEEEEETRVKTTTCGANVVRGATRDSSRKARGLPSCVCKPSRFGNTGGSKVGVFVKRIQKSSKKASFPKIRRVTTKHRAL